MISFFSGSGRRAPACAALLALVLLGAAPVPGLAADVEHTVAKGQTLGRIAKRYRTTVDVLLEVNGLKRGQRIHPGDRLIIPERGKEAEAAKRAAAARKEARRRGAAKSARKGKRAKDKSKAAKDRKAEAAQKRAAAKGYARKPKRPGWVRMVRGTETLEVRLLTRRRRLVPKALPKLSHLLRSPKGSIAIDPRLATLIGLVSDHFGGRTIHVISGYRPYSPEQYTPHSNHNVGRAMDFMIEGVPNTVVRDFCKSFKNAGVGYYPNSTFVHLDTRPGKVHWVDYSHPGEPPRYDSSSPRVAPDEAAQNVSKNTQNSTQGAASGSKITPPDDSQIYENKDVN